jgi:isoquinoline 1-oxidoreductase beta subunit
VPRLDTDHRQARFSKSTVKPLRQWPGFQPNPFEVVGGIRQHRQQAERSRATTRRILKEGLDSDQAIIGNQAGDVQAALASAAKVVEALYAFPYRIHATMEPMNATARYTSDRCEVWAPTQMAEDSLRAAAQAAGLPLEKCDLHKTFIGGGFGRRGAPTDYVRQAVTVAKAMPGTPIKLLWSREASSTSCAWATMPSR